ncbi:hypothetical protein [Kutzneria sp. 744]|uniref:hypothetical protein n=1 Tax=Kutzneria sp. (strain 744) TaxID=345341 RepID=UPI0005B79654|nr:hypothetical protein [Kutzneria sp. 744]
MAVNDDRKGGPADEADSPFLDSLYWTLVERLTEFVSTPLPGVEHSVAGVVRTHASTARVFVFDGANLSTMVGIDCPLLDHAGEQMDHFRHITTLGQVVRSIARGDDADVERDVDSHGFPIVDARAFYERDEKARTTLREAIFGSIASTLHHFSSEPPSSGARIIYPVGFLTIGPDTVRVYFRDPETKETSGFDLGVLSPEGDFAVAAGGLLRARIRELVGTNALATREISASSDQYCARAYSMP